MMQITSPQNPRIKALLPLMYKSSERRKTGLFCVEGVREVERALRMGYQAESIFFCPHIFPEAQLQTLKFDPAETAVFALSEQAYAKIAYRDNTQGIIAVMKQKAHLLADLSLGNNPLILVLEAIEKPGNLGAVLRTADAAGVDAVIVCDEQTDIYHPNVIRSSTGTIFSVPLARSESQEVIAFLKAQRIQILTTSLQAAYPYTSADLCRATALVLGTEAQGISQQWLTAADVSIIIPMRGIADSLNVSVSAAVLAFEALRQRSV